MITIGKPYVTTEGDRAYLRAEVSIPKEAAYAYMDAVAPKREFLVWMIDEDYPPKAWDEPGHDLWFDVPSEYEKYLCSERSNTFVTALFWYAMVTGQDISFEAPISERLYRGFTEMLMPQLEKAGFRQIKLIGPVTSEPVWCEGGVVAGMSGGVDSFYTLACYGNDPAPDGLKLTHLSHYTCSNLFKPDDVRTKSVEQAFVDEEEIENIIVERVKKIASEKGMPMIVTNTNLDRDFYRGGYAYMAMYRYLSCTLALEHLYRTYISSSSGHNDNVFELTLFCPTQHYESLLVESLQTETFSYVSSDNVKRTEKLRAIADDEVFRKNVTVCFDTKKDGANCGVCYGCMKTMMPLDMLGRLDGFSESFDLRSYYRERRDRFKFLLDFARRPEASSARETVEQLKELAQMEQSEAGREFLEVMCALPAAANSMPTCRSRRSHEADQSRKV